MTSEGNCASDDDAASWQPVPGAYVTEEGEDYAYRTCALYECPICAGRRAPQQPRQAPITFRLIMEARP